MAENWLDLQADISADLRKEGQQFTMSRLVRGEFDPIKSTFESAQEEQFQVFGIFKSLGTLSIESSYSFTWSPETTVRVGDKVLMLECSGYQAQIGDFLVIDGQKWLVIAYALLDPGNVPLLQYALVRRG